MIDPHVAHLEARRDGQHDVGEVGVVLEPGVLEQDELEVLAAQRLEVLVAAVPARRPARRVGPYHVEERLALAGELELLHLVLCRHHADNVAVPREGLLAHDALGDQRLGDEAIRFIKERSIVTGPTSKIRLVARHRRVVRVLVNIPLDELHEVATRFAEALHGKQANFHASRLMSVA